MTRNHKDVARQSRNQNPSRELRESSVAAVYDRRQCRAHGSPAVIDRRYSRFRVIRGQQTCQKTRRYAFVTQKAQRKAASKNLYLRPFFVPLVSLWFLIYVTVFA